MKGKVFQFSRKHVKIALLNYYPTLKIAGLNYYPTLKKVGLRRKKGSGKIMYINNLENSTGIMVKSNFSLYK